MASPIREFFRPIRLYKSSAVMWSVLRKALSITSRCLVSFRFFLAKWFFKRAASLSMVFKPILIIIINIIKSGACQPTFLGLMGMCLPLILNLLICINRGGTENGKKVDYRIGFIQLYQVPSSGLFGCQWGPWWKGGGESFCKTVVGDGPANGTGLPA